MAPDAPIDDAQIARMVNASSILRIPADVVKEVQDIAKQYNAKRDLLSSALPWGAYGKLRRVLRGRSIRAA